MSEGHPQESISDRDVNSKPSTEGGLWASPNAATRRTVRRRGLGAGSEGVLEQGLNEEKEEDSTAQVEQQQLGWLRAERSEH